MHDNRAKPAPQQRRTSFNLQGSCLLSFSPLSLLQFLRFLVSCSCITIAYYLRYRVKHRLITTSRSELRHEPPKKPTISLSIFTQVRRLSLGSRHLSFLSTTSRHQPCLTSLPLHLSTSLPLPLPLPNPALPTTYTYIIPTYGTCRY